MDIPRAFGANAEVQNYVRRVGTLFGGDIGSLWGARLTSCLEGIYSTLGGRSNGRNTLVDALFMGANCNVGSGGSALSLRGRTITLGGTTIPTWAAEGVLLDGVSQYLQMAGIPDFRTGTIMLVLAGSYTAATDNGTLYSISPQAGIDTATAHAGVWGGTKAAGAAIQGYTRQGGAATVTTAVVGSTSALGWGINDGAFHCFAVSNDNAASPTLTHYVDGVQSAVDAAGNTQATTACTLLTVGGWQFSGAPATFTRCTVQAVLLFNRVLTAAEVQGVSRALQFVQPEDFILACEGESTTYFNNSPAANPTPGQEWPAQLRTSLGSSNSRWRIQNWAYTGDVLSNILATWPNQIQQYRPGGRYRDGAVVIWEGINDLLAGSAAATILTALSAVWAIARENGFKVIANTLIPGSGYTGAQNTQRIALNALIRGAASQYDILLEPDLVFTDTAASYFFDGFHLTPAGYLTYANLVRSKLRI